MQLFPHLRITFTSIFTALFIVACGGGGSSNEGGASAGSSINERSLPAEEQGLVSLEILEGTDELPHSPYRKANSVLQSSRDYRMEAIFLNKPRDITFYAVGEDGEENIIEQNPNDIEERFYYSGSFSALLDRQLRQTTKRVHRCDNLSIGLQPHHMG